MGILLTASTVQAQAVSDWDRFKLFNACRPMMLEHFHVMLSYGWIGKVVRALLGPGMRSRERGPDRLGSLSDASEITENALVVEGLPPDAYGYQTRTAADKLHDQVAKKYDQAEKLASQIAHPFFVAASLKTTT